MSDGQTDSVVPGYAEAIVIVSVAEDVVERVSDELYQFANALDEHTELRDRLTDIAVPVEDKLGIIAELLAEKAHPQTVAALLYVIQAGRARLLPEIAEAVAERAAERSDRVLAEVRVAKPLDDDRRQRMAEALERATGKKIDMKVVVDPDLMGGVSVRVGDTVIDGSVARRLDELKARLVGT
jgi:F-type H+-transporting ATPase subunit delta